jgi:hypothetical protein
VESSTGGGEVQAARGGLSIILPYQTLVFQSALREPQVLERLAAAIEFGPSVRRDYTDCPFEGIIEDRTFEIRRIIRYRSNLAPVLHGRIEPGLLGRARITVAFRPDPLVAVGIVLCFGLVLGGGAIGLSGPPRPGEPPGLPVLAGMLAVGVLVVLGGFWLEAATARSLLQDIMVAVPFDEPSGP